MLFLLKRTWVTALLGLSGLTLLATLLRFIVPAPLSVDFSLDILINGLLVFALVLCSDGLIHGLLLLTTGQWYRERHRELAGLFHGQTVAAIVCGALMAGVGEELLFRSLDPGAVYLFGSAIVFGLLHHLSRRLWLITLWAIWQGLLLSAAMFYFQQPGVTMTAHFLHDLTGFLVFRYVYSSSSQHAATTVTL